MVYSTIPDTDIDSDSIVIQDIFFKLRDNIEALHTPTGADLGYAGQDHLGNGSVGQAELKTGTQTFTRASATVLEESYAYGAKTLFTEPLYSLGFRHYKTTSPVSSGHRSIFEDYMEHNDNTPGGRYGRVGIYNESSVDDITGSATCEVLYVNASPPYDLGDGEIPLFLYVFMVDGVVNTITSMDDPPWAHNGPNSIMPTRRDKSNGIRKAYRTILNVDEESGEVSKEEVEIDTAFKNKDMDLFPHPFAEVGENDQVILLDPVDTLYLAELRSSGENIDMLIVNDYLRLDNETINRSVPRGVIPSKFKWKNSRSRAGEAKADRRLKRGAFADRPRGGPRGG